MKTPAFWNSAPGLLSWLLSPLGWLYGKATAWRMHRAGEALPVPIICIGNFTAGGTGKTPAALLIGRLLKERGETPFFLSRGYGGVLKGALRVDPQQHGSAECGDEPLLLARCAPTIIAKDRLAGARLAIKQGASVIIMDDGLQNSALQKDFTLAVLDGSVGLGNGFCIPAGPLRAPIAAQLPLVDAVLRIDGGETGVSASLSTSMKRLTLAKPMLTGSFAPDAVIIASLQGKQLMAFAGIGRPQKFFDTLKQAGLSIGGTQAFADHHRYSAQEMAALRLSASGNNMLLVTTEKDAVRLDGNVEDIAVLPVALQTDISTLMDLLMQAIDRRCLQNALHAGN